MAQSKAFGIARGFGAASVAGLLPALLFGVAGSSTGARAFTEFTGYTDNPLVTAGTNGTTYSQLGGVGAGAHLLGNALAAALVPAVYSRVEFIKGAVGGTRVVDWLSNLNNIYSNEVAALNAAKASGRTIAGIIWQGGANDALQETCVSEADHLANCRTLFARFRADTSLPNLLFIIGGTQKLTGSAAIELQSTWVRAAEITLAGDANNYLSCPTIDLPQQSDGIHQTEAAYPISWGGRHPETIISVLTGGAGKRGPRLVSGIALDNTHTRFTIAHGTGTDFTPTSGITGMKISLDGGTTRTAITAGVRVDATHFDATHADTGGAAFRAYWLQDGVPDTSGIIIDNTAPVGLPMDPGTTAGIAVAAGGGVTAPGFATPPAIYGGSSQGMTLAVTKLNTTGGAATATYQWFRGTIATPIAGATSATYTTVAGDLALGVGCRVKLVNAAAPSGVTADSNLITITAAAGNFTFDLFDGAASTALTSHADNTGKAWTAPQGVPVLDGTGGVHQSTSAAVLALDGFVPTTPEYDIRGIVEFTTLRAGENVLVAGRATGSADRISGGYLPGAPTPGWAIAETIASGAPVYKGTGTAFSPVAGGRYNLLCEIRNTRETLLVDGIKVAEFVGTPGVAAKGSGGLRLSGGAAASPTDGARFLYCAVGDPGLV